MKEAESLILLQFQAYLIFSAPPKRTPLELLEIKLESQMEFSSFFSKFQVGTDKCTREQILKPK